MSELETQPSAQIPEIVLTASALALAVGCHQTTISRAIGDGRVVPDFLISTATGRPLIGFRTGRQGEIAELLGIRAASALEG